MKDIVHQPHDKLFRVAMAHKQVAIDFLSNRLPKSIKDKVDFGSLKIEKRTFIDKKLKSLESDVVFSLNILDKPGYIYTLVEHQSKEDPYQVIRLIEYNAKLLKTHLNRNPKEKKYPIIINLVCYSGLKAYKGPISIADAFYDPNQFIQSMKDPFLIDLNREQDDDILRDKSAALVNVLLKYGKLRDLCALLEKEQIKKLIIDSVYQTEAVVYVIDRDKHDYEFVLNKLLNLNTKSKEEIMSGLQRILEKGRQEGKLEILRKMIAQGLITPEQAEKLK